MATHPKIIDTHHIHSVCPFCGFDNNVLIEQPLTEAEVYCLQNGTPWYLLFKNLTFGQRLALSTGLHEECEEYADLSTLQKLPD